MSALPENAVQGATGARGFRSERVLAGIGMVILAVACFSMLDATAKISTTAVPILMGVWFRYAFQAVATTAVLLPRHGTALLRTAHPRFHVLRGALLLLTSVLAFLSLRYMPLPEFTAIVLIGPLVVTLLAATFLRSACRLFAGCWWRAASRAPW